MAELSLALYEAYAKCGSIRAVADRLNLPFHFVEQRVEAARLSLLIAAASTDDPSCVVLASSGSPVSLAPRID